MSNIEIFSPQYNKKIRGFAKITLDNGREKRVVESENTFYGSNISAYYNTLGQVKKYNAYTWNHAVGGIFLFNQTIPSGSEYMPAGTKMIGNGSYNVINTSAPNELGTNSSNVVSSNSIEMNYSWDTSHGNGVINSVCLTSDIGGLIGYGNPSGTRRSIITDFAESNYPNSPAGYYWKGYSYQMSVASGVLTITKTPSNIGVASIFSATETITHELQLNNQGGNIVGSDGKIFLFNLRGLSWNVNTQAPVSLIIYDIDTDTVTERYPVNKTGSKITHDNTNSFDSDIRFVDIPNHRMFLGNAVWSSDSPNKIFYVDYLTDDVINGSSFNDKNKVVTRMAPDLFLYGENVNSYNKTENYWVYDTVNDTLYPSNGSIFVRLNVTGGHNLPAYQPQDDCFVQSTYRNSDSKQGFATNPLYLATINNLAEPVTKTDTDILQIKYTLVSE